MLRAVVFLLVMIKLVDPQENNDKHIKVIDIFTNYPSTEEVLKDYTIIKKRRQRSSQELQLQQPQIVNASSRSFNEYDDYYRPQYDDYYDKNYYGNKKYHDDNKYYSSSTGDVLESEFGIFDIKKSQNYADRFNDKYVYVQGQKYSDYVPSYSLNHYTIQNPQSVDDNADNFKDKLNQFIAEVEKRPQFYTSTRKNDTRFEVIKPITYADQFTFKPNDKLTQLFTLNHPIQQNHQIISTYNDYTSTSSYDYDATTEEETDPLESEYGEIVTRPTVKLTTKPPKKGTVVPLKKPPRRKIKKVKKPQINQQHIQQSQNVLNHGGVIVTDSAEILEDQPANNTREKLTNMLRRYLVNMHKRKKFGNRKNRNYNKDRMGFFSNKLYDMKKAQFDNLKIVDDGQTKYFTQPLESIKNKTIKFAHKFLSLFTVIQFENFKCQASSGATAYEGTCYLSTECATMGGTAMGNCANGYGVCCVFRGTCGGSGSNNCTYFESPGYPNYFPDGGGVVTPTASPTTTTTIGGNVPDPRLPQLFMEGRQSTSDNANALSCIFQVSKFNDSIKQMRIDFIDLELTGPTDGQCLNERLVISGSGIGTMVPVICGYNTGQHVYVDVSMLSGPLQLAVLANTIQRKRYKLRICQYSDGCSGQMNCLQYFTGITGMITSFNYDQASTFSRSTPMYLNNLNYAICIRREPGYCTVTYSNVANNVVYPFELRNYDDDGSLTVPAGQAGVGVLNCPDDYIVINGIRLCGERLNDGSIQENFSLNAPVTDFSGGPIIIPVRTSNVVNGRGFKLFYMQNRCGTVTGTGMVGGGGVPDPRL